MVYFNVHVCHVSANSSLCCMQGVCSRVAIAASKRTFSLILENKFFKLCFLLDF